MYRHRPGYAESDHSTASLRMNHPLTKQREIDHAGLVTNDQHMVGHEKTTGKAHTNNKPPSHGKNMHTHISIHVVSRSSQVA